MAARKKKARPEKAKTLKTALREDLFVRAYLATRNGTKAAELAGYSARSADRKAVELLKRPRVRVAIDAAQARITKKYDVSAERVLEEMAIVGFSDIRNYHLTDEGYLELAEGAPDRAIRAIKKIRRKLRLIPQKISTENPDGRPIREVESEFELWSKDAQLRNLGEYLKLFKENRGGDEDPDTSDLTPEQRKERIIALLRVLASRKKSAKKAG